MAKNSRPPTRWRPYDRLASLHGELAQANSLATWREVAAAIDEESGGAAWRDDDDSEHYDAGLLRRELKQLKQRREAQDALGLVDAVEATLLRHLGDLAAAELYAGALSGTKRLVCAWLDEVELALRWLVDAQIPGVSNATKLRRFERALRVHGRSALALSGGATWGFHHLGVVKALFENNLLPSILSGASTGAMVASGVCARTDAELADLFAHPEQMRLDGLKPVGVRSAWKAGGWLDPAQLRAVLRHNVGDATFKEAHAHSGRVLNIAVAPVRTRQKPKLLSHLTSPDVFLHSAALASSALPGLFPPVVLEARARDGSTQPYLGSERWVDGSLYADLPKLRLARLHNANHFILSQTNPHVLPILQLSSRGRGVWPAVADFTSSAVKAQGHFAIDLVSRFTPARDGHLQLAAERARALVGQSYRGDIDIHPRFRAELLRKVVVNLTPTDLDTFIFEGERSVWPVLARISDQTRVERVLGECVAALKTREP